MVASPKVKAKPAAPAGGKPAGAARDARGRLYGDPTWGRMPAGYRSAAVRFSAPAAATAAFEALSPRERGAVIAAWHAAGAKLD